MNCELCVMEIGKYVVQVEVMKVGFSCEVVFCKLGEFDIEVEVVVYVR